MRFSKLLLCPNWRGLIGFGCTLFVCSAASAIQIDRHPQLVAFIDEMVSQQQFDRAELLTLFGGVEYKSSVIKAITRPAEGLPWFRYQERFVTADAGAKGAAFIREHQAAFDAASKTYGVPDYVIAAIIGVETRYGKNMGSFRVIDSLTTLVVDYPRRRKFFASELENLLMLSREEDVDPLTISGSYAGAIGLGQFMPSSYRRYAVDFDGDDQRDLVNSREDGIGSVANYFAEHGWRKNGRVAERVRLSRKAATSDRFSSGREAVTSAADLRALGVEVSSDVGNDTRVGLIKLDGKDRKLYYLAYPNFYVIMRYNPSVLYAMAVHQLSEKIRAAQ